jgi:hypothetical protein
MMTRTFARRAGVAVGAVVLAAGVSSLFVGPAFAESQDQSSDVVDSGGKVPAQQDEVACVGDAVRKLDPNQGLQCVVLPLANGR